MFLRSTYRLLRRLGRSTIVIIVLLLLEAAGAAPFLQSHLYLGFLAIGAALIVPWAFPPRSPVGGECPPTAPAEGGRAASWLRSGQRRVLACEEQTLASPPRRTLIVGAGEAGTALARDLEEHFPADYDIVGFVEDDPGIGSENGWKILGRSEEIAELVRRHEVAEVIVATGSPLREGELPLDTHSLRALVASLTLEPEQPNRYAFWKRFFDVVFSLTALIATAPALGLAALAVKLTSAGPVFYAQERVGRGGGPFTIYKLRTMVCGAEDGTGPVLAQPRDPRITRVGRVLRATKLDEVPQFFNVLRGDMSVIGPRPERPCFVEEYCRHIPAYRERHRARPGISGLAQVNGGYRTHVYVKLRYDLLYVSRQSLWLDLQIVARTLRAILQNLNGEY
jgi:lipopolysaccharide/colanic/teichoic acid biosynthesis glycosyltransferase